MKAGLHRLPEVDADLPEVNFDANPEAIAAEIRITYYKKYIENEPSVVVPPVVELPIVAAESAEPEIDHEENVALKLNQAHGFTLKKTFSGRRAPAISCW